MNRYRKFMASSEQVSAAILVFVVLQLAFALVNLFAQEVYLDRISSLEKRIARIERLK